MEGGVEAVGAEKRVATRQPQPLAKSAVPGKEAKGKAVRNSKEYKLGRREILLKRNETDS